MERLNENYQNFCDILLIETLGAFENQYQICNEIAPIILEMFKKHITDNVIDIETKSPIKQVQVSLNKNEEKGTMYVQTHGQIYFVNYETKKVAIDIHIPQSFLLNKSDDFILKEIKNCISHEFMHANVFMKRMTNGADVPDLLDNYDTYLKIIQFENENTILYKYAYGMYSTYYQEMNAIVSQTTQQLKNQLNNNIHASNDEIKKAIQKTEPYQIYTTNAYDLGYYLKDSKEGEVIWECLVNDLKKYGINISINQLEKNIKKIILRSNIALKKIMKNAMNFMI